MTPIKSLLISTVSITLLLALLPGAAVTQHSARTAQPRAGPAFVFPSNGQTFPYRGPYLFQVQPLNGARG